MMNKPFASLIIIALSILFVASCTEKPANLITPKNVNNIQFLSKAELEDVERVLNHTPTQEYDYRVVRVQRQTSDKRKLVTLKESDFRGLLFMRNREHFDPLGGAFYDDGRGNLMQFGGQDQVFAITYMADGENILAIDANRDEVIDTAMGNSGNDHFWLISSRIAELFPCLSSAEGDLYSALLDCTQPQGPDGAGGLNGGSGTDTDTGLGSGLLLGDPDCEAELPGGGVVTGDDPETPPGEDPAPPPPPPTTKSPDDDDYPPMGVNENVSDDGNRRLHTMRTSDKLIERYTATDPDGSITRTVIHRDSQGRETYREDSMVGPSGRLLMHRVNETTYDEDGNPNSTVKVSRQARSGRSLEPVNPDGSTVFEDPRCAGRDTRNLQGLGFLDLCADQDSTDFLGCYRQLENPLFNLTGGRCTLGPGPAGGTVLHCGDDKSTLECIAGGGSPEECGQDGPASDDILGPGGSGSGRVDGPGVPTSQDEIETKFIDTVPLGAVIMGICSRGGCPDPRP